MAQELSRRPFPLIGIFLTNQCAYGVAGMETRTHTHTHVRNWHGFRATGGLMEMTKASFQAGLEEGVRLP